MEVRTIEEVKIYILKLNDMRSPKIEMSNEVKIAYDRETLEKFMQNEMCEPYTDERWGKSFKKGGPLEWYNQPIKDFGQGIVESWQRKDFVDRMIAAYPHQFLAAI